jgi:hypothetical protein
VAERTPAGPEKQFIVTLTDRRCTGTWGPFAARSDAEEFAEFVTCEIDPAEVRTLSSPAGELLAWRRAMQELNRD